jgi:hypothetical protein
MLENNPAIKALFERGAAVNDGNDLAGDDVDAPTILDLCCGQGALTYTVL